MKKLLLTLAISIIWFIGFSSADHVSCTYEEDFNCEPSWIDNIELNKFTISFDFDWESFINSLEDDLSIYLRSDEADILILHCDYNQLECYNYDVDVNVYEDKNSSFKWNFLPFVSSYFWEWIFNVDFSYTITDNEENEPDEPDEPWTWWNENPPVIPDNPWDWWNWWNIVPDWSLVAVIIWVFSVFTELIPYIIYLWIWILIVTVWFYAIRWLLNWVSNKVNNNFKF